MLWIQALLAQGQSLTQSQMWLLIGLGSAAMIYTVVLRPMFRKQKDPLDRPANFAGISQQRSVERLMQNLLVELSEMARQITAQLDTRSAKLELLLKEADAKIAALKAASNGSHAPNLGTVEPSASEPQQESDPRHAEIYALADQGRDAREIASQLGRPRGEVELILALRSR